MGDASNSFRLAIGVFYEPQRLESAIGELHADSLSTHELCLAGTRQALEALEQTASDSPSTGYKALFKNLQPLAPLIENAEMVATAGDLLRALLEHAKTNERNSPFAKFWRLPEIFGGLTGELRDGAVALLVSAPDPDQQRRSSQILLRHSAHTVQTHEFTPRPAGSA